MIATAESGFILRKYSVEKRTPENKTVSKIRCRLSGHECWHEWKQLLRIIYFNVFVSYSKYEIKGNIFNTFCRVKTNNLGQIYHLMWRHEERALWTVLNSSVREAGIYLKTTW